MAQRVDGDVRKPYDAREKTVAEIGELFGTTRESVYRCVNADATA